MDHLLHDSSPIIRKRKLAPDASPPTTTTALAISDDNDHHHHHDYHHHHRRNQPRPTRPLMPQLKPDPTSVAPEAVQEAAVGTGGVVADVAPRPPTSSSAAWSPLPAVDSTVWAQPSPTTETAMWSQQTQPASPSSPKRPRTESIPPTPQATASTSSSATASPASSPRRTKPSASSASASSSSSPASASGRPRRPGRRPTTPRETGAADPELSLESLPECALPFEPNTAYLPSLRPPVTRETLKELDLESILRNPQLRHDLLFDSGLQFRPTASRRKRDAVEGYWTAIQRELESGCTCASFDFAHQPHALVCACAQFPAAPSQPLLTVFPRERVMTVRMPSRVPPLLAELLAILLSVIEPLPSATPGVYMQEPTGSPLGQRRQAHQHATQAATLHAVLDPDLIKQEVEHGLFDPRGMFRVIGETLKCHCAPMRDGAVEAMVAVGQTCAPGAGGTYASAVQALRMCFEVLEFMKLDIANHQLQTLRPYLVQSSPEFELKTFQERSAGQLSLKVTRKWLNSARKALLTSPTPVPAALSTPFSALPRNAQIKFATLKAITDLVFVPPSVEANADGLATYPETLHLDQSRLHALSVTSADLTALYMYMMLFRQLVHSGAPTCTSCGRRRAAPKIEDEDLARIKREIWEVGPSKLGYCFWHAEPTPSTSVVPGMAEVPPTTKEERDWARWRRKTRDVSLQLAVRAADVQRRGVCSSSCVGEAAQDAEGAPPAPPSTEMVRLAESWVESNLRRGSPLSVLLRDRLRAAVFADVAAGSSSSSTPAAVPPVPAASSTAPAAAGAPAPVSAAAVLPAVPSSGLEPLAREIRHLADKAEKVASAHVNVYGRLYEQPGFLAL